MNERAIFMEALDRETLAERAAYLDEACGGDTALRRRVEALLTSHEQAGGFLGKPVPQRLAGGLASPGTLAETQVELPAADGGGRLDFLTASDKPGSLGRLGHYEIQEVIGRGGFGIVLRAFDEMLHRVVAVKVMAPHLAATSPARKRFLREARASAAIRHENVVAIYAVEEQPIPYLVMEFIAGQTLQAKLDQTGPLGTAEVLRVGRQLADGLDAAHARGLIHRDIKPANILLENGVEPRVKITDFGLARAADDASISQSGIIAGTPMFMAPEQALGHKIDQRADLFSLGSVLYTACSGRPPFRASTTLAVLKRVVDDTPRPIREIIPEVPEWLAAIIARLHAKDPAERYKSAAEVAELLGQRLAQLQHPSSPAPPVVGGSGDPATTELHRRRGRRWALTAALALCLLGGLSLAETTGVTHIGETVIRILAPHSMPVAAAEHQASGRKDRPNKWSRIAEAERPAWSGNDTDDDWRKRYQSSPILQAARDEAKAGHWEEAAAGFAEALDFLPSGEMWDNPRKCACRELANWDEVFARVLHLRPKDRDLWLGRARQLALRYNWAEAAEAYPKGIGPPSSRDESFEYGCVLCLCGDYQAYNAWCQQLLGVKAEGDLPSFLLIRTLALAPQPVMPPAEMVLRSHQVVKNNANAWHLHALALAHFRAGEYDLAIQRARESDTMLWHAPARAQNWLLLALAHQRLGHTDEARSWQDRALQAIEQEIPANTGSRLSVPVPDWLEAEVLRREVEAALRGAAAPSHLQAKAHPPAGAMFQDAVLHMTFEKDSFYEKDGKTYVRDLSGNGYDGLCEGDAPDVKAGGGLKCDGKGWLQIPHSLLNHQAKYTITAWVRLQKNAPDGELFKECSSQNDLMIYDISFVPSGGFFCAAWNRIARGNWINCDKPGVFPYEKWFFLTIALENGGAETGSLRVTIDGKEYHLPSQMVDSPLEDVCVTLGRRLEGTLGEVSVFHRFLSAGEIEAIRRRGSDKAPPP
jgi:serine/threonine protein kinase/tetratricopeptide (TPR) repeat protein